jgi:hypothetical protein
MCLQAASQDEIRIYPRKEKLDNSFAKILKVDAQVLLISISQSGEQNRGRSQFDY